MNEIIFNKEQNQSLITQMVMYDFNGIPKTKIDLCADKSQSDELLPCYVGEEFDSEGFLIFKGKFRNGVKCGKGTEYHKSGVAIFEGEFKDGLRNGVGLELLPNGSKLYEGDYQDNFKEGYGILYNNNKMQYEGFWKENEYHGEGKSLYGNGIIEKEGYFLKSSKYFKGTVYNPQGKIRYQGEGLNGEANGIGSSYYLNGKVKYAGHWKDDKYFGNGVLYNNDGTRSCEGVFRNNQMDGYGVNYDYSGNPICRGRWREGYLDQLYMEPTLCSKNNDILEISKCYFYLGEIKNNEPNGFGYEFNRYLSKKTYEGMWKDGKKHGAKGKMFEGDLYFMNYYGEFKDNYPNGKGILYHPNGKMNARGWFINGDKVRFGGKSEFFGVEFRMNGSIVKESYC